MQMACLQEAGRRLLTHLKPLSALQEEQQLNTQLEGHAAGRSMC